MPPCLVVARAPHLEGRGRAGTDLVRAAVAHAVQGVGQGLRPLVLAQALPRLPASQATLVLALVLALALVLVLVLEWEPVLVLEWVLVLVPEWEYPLRLQRLVPPMARSPVLVPERVSVSTCCPHLLSVVAQQPPVASGPVVASLAACAPWQVTCPQAASPGVSRAAPHAGRTWTACGCVRQAPPCQGAVDALEPGERQGRAVVRVTAWTAAVEAARAWRREAVVLHEVAAPDQPEEAVAASPAHAEAVV